MMRNKLLLLLILIISILTGCDTPVSQAKAEHIQAKAAILRAEAQATQEATNYVAARHADTLAILEATQPMRVTAKSNLIWWSSVSAIVALTSCTVIGIVTFGYTSMGWARATVASVTLRSQMIHIDAGTRTWPVLITPGGNIMNLETGSVYRADTPQLADPRQLQISSRVREGGLYADAAVRMAKATRDGRAGDALGIVAGNIPTMGEWIDASTG